MKSTFTLLVLISSLATSSTIPPHMLERNSLQSGLVFTTNNKVFPRKSREARKSRETRKSRDARECRFYLRKMPRTIEVRISRIDKEKITHNLIEKQGTKVAIAR